MLFSQPELAAWMSDTFECAWEPLRDVPRVSIDFGDDRVVRRTLHGNVVTWICDAEGRALDALGGLYAAAPYRARLEQAALLATYLAQQTDPSARAAAFHDYHARQAERTTEGGTPLVVGIPPVSAFAKVATERATELAIVDPSARQFPIGASKGAVEVRFEQALGAPAPAVALDVPRPSGRTVAAPGVRADKGLLEQDTTLGETRFRPAIDRLLAESGSVPYASLTKSVYRDVLRVDLDDPWLGLHELLFDSYPFDV